MLSQAKVRLLNGTRNWSPNSPYRSAIRLRVCACTMNFPIRVTSKTTSHFLLSPRPQHISAFSATPVEFLFRIVPGRLSRSSLKFHLAWYHSLPPLPSVVRCVCFQYFLWLEFTGTRKPFFEYISSWKTASNFIIFIYIKVMFDSSNLSDEVPFCYRGFSFCEYIV